MKKDLVNQRQPFGEVKNVTMHPGLPIQHGAPNRPGAKSERFNNHYDSKISNSDPNPRAMDQATTHSDNPFYYVYESFKK